MQKYEKQKREVKQEKETEKGKKKLKKNKKKICEVFYPSNLVRVI